MFVRYVSHEIRTPLNTVFLGLKLLKRDLITIGSDEETVRIITDIQSSCETAIETLNGLLDYEKLESGIMKLEKTQMSPWPLIRDSVTPFMIQVREDPRPRGDASLRKTLLIICFSIIQIYLTNTFYIF